MPRSPCKRARTGPSFEDVFKDGSSFGGSSNTRENPAPGSQGSGSTQPSFSEVSSSEKSPKASSEATKQGKSQGNWSRWDEVEAPLSLGDATNEPGAVDAPNKEKPQAKQDNPPAVAIEEASSTFRKEEEKATANTINALRSGRSERKERARGLFMKVHSEVMKKADREGYPAAGAIPTEEEEFTMAALKEEVQAQKEIWEEEMIDLFHHRSAPHRQDDRGEFFGQIAVFLFTVTAICYERWGTCRNPIEASFLKFDDEEVAANHVSAVSGLLKFLVEQNIAKERYTRPTGLARTHIVMAWQEALKIHDAVMLRMEDALKHEGEEACPFWTFGVLYRQESE